MQTAFATELAFNLIGVAVDDHFIFAEFDSMQRSRISVKRKRRNAIPQILQFNSFELSFLTSHTNSK